MKRKQVVILLMAFVLPICIFIFLKVLGKNEFAVEPFYQNGEVPLNLECKDRAMVPYLVPEELAKKNNWKASDSLALYIYDVNGLDLRDLELRLTKDLKNHELNRWLIVSDSSQATSIGNAWQFLIKDKEVKRSEENCVYLMEKGKSSVLIDNKRRIRGYYDLKDRKEIDRLLVEVSIILKKY